MNIELLYSRHPAQPALRAGKTVTTGTLTDAGPVSAGPVGELLASRYNAALDSFCLSTNAAMTVYNRNLLLSGVKRHAVLDLAEVQQYGIDNYGDPEYVSIYGLTPANWYAKGVRLLGRTVVECTRDPLGNAIGGDVASVASALAPTSAAPVVVDPFAGSANTLYWLLSHVPRARGLGFELDDGVFQCSQQNMAALALPIEILNVDFRSGLANLSLAPDQLLIAFIAPPWGDALDEVRGLDLRRTTPPVTQILDVLYDGFAQNRLLVAVQIHESVDPGSLDEAKARLDWWALHIYDLNTPGQKHGILLGTKGWTPAGIAYNRP